MKFTFATDKTAWTAGEAVNAPLQLAVERAFSRQLELMGFRQVSPSEVPWYVIEVALQQSAFIPNLINGSIIFEPLPNWNRDAMLAKSAGAIRDDNTFSRGHTVEFGSRWNRVDPAVALDGLMRGAAQGAWEMNAVTLTQMCEFRADLLRKGLSVEGLRRELAAEMERLRAASRQRKQLDIRVEDE